MFITYPLARLLAHRHSLMMAFLQAMLACATVGDGGADTGIEVSVDGPTQSDPPVDYSNSASPNATQSSYTAPVATVVARQTVGGATLARTYGGVPILAADGCQLVYLLNTENDGSAQGAMVFYRSSDRAKSWLRTGATIPIAASQCAQAFAALPMVGNGSNSHRLVVTKMLCGTDSLCVVQAYISDDGGDRWTLSGNATGTFFSDWCSSTMAVDDTGGLHLFYSTNGTAGGVNNSNAIMQNVSTDGAQSWSTNRKVLTVDVFPRWPSGIAVGAVGSHRMVVVYEQQTFTPNHTWEIGGVYSADNGRTWSSPAVLIPSPSDATVSAPSMALADKQTVALTLQRSNADHDTGHEVQLYFAPVPSSGLPVFNKATTLSLDPTFPESIASFGDGNIVVVTAQSASTGATLSRVTLQRKL